MELQNNTVLITGGGSGIGLAVAKTLSHMGNKVIITGRNAGKLRRAVEEIPHAEALICDVTDSNQVEYLVRKVKSLYPTVNVLINNAGRAFAYELGPGSGSYEKATDEFATNLFGVIRLTEELLPTLLTQQHSAIVNVSSLLAFVPARLLPTYSASKSALHSYTQALRLALLPNGTKVFELMPPLVDTELSRGLSGTAMKPEEVAMDLVHAMQNNEYEVHPGMTAAVYDEYLASPESAFKIINRIRD